MATSSLNEASFPGSAGKEDGYGGGGEGGCYVGASVRLLIPELLRPPPTPFYIGLQIFKDDLNGFSSTSDICCTRKRFVNQAYIIRLYTALHTTQSFFGSCTLYSK